MSDHHQIDLGDGRRAKVLFTDASDGDFRVLDPTPGLEERRQQVTGGAGPWSWLRQVHGAELHRVTEPAEHAGTEGDGLLTTETACPIAVMTADCAPVVLAAEGGIAVVHAGWRGLVAGIIERAGAELRAVAGAPVTAMLGPCISPAAYRFGPEDLATVIDRYGPEVAGTTDDGDPALDVPAAVAVACRRAGWPAPPAPSCTSDPRWFSHRTRADGSRQCVVAWIESVGATDGG